MPLVNIIGTAIDKIKSFVASAKSAINGLIDLYNSIPLLPNVNKIEFMPQQPSPSVPGLINLAPQGGFGALTVSSPSSGYQRSSQPVYINVNSPSIIDETGFTRAVVDALNSVERRSAGGLSALTV